MTNTYDVWVKDKRSNHEWVDSRHKNIGPAHERSRQLQILTPDYEVTIAHPLTPELTKTIRLSVKLDKDELTWLVNMVERHIKQLENTLVIDGDFLTASGLKELEVEEATANNVKDKLYKMVKNHV